MNFKEAKKLMVNEKKDIKLPSWSGFWRYEKCTIMMHCKDNTVIDIRDSQDVLYTIDNILSDDWEVATSENCPLLGGKILLPFEKAKEYINKGIEMTRDAWINSKVYVDKASGKLIKYDGIKKTYSFTLDDTNANDWTFAKQ